MDDASHILQLAIRLNLPALLPLQVNLLMEVWTQLGDRIALQYGGSEAHKKVGQRRSRTAL
jgi:hypothetical protein